MRAPLRPVGTAIGSPGVQPGAGRRRGRIVARPPVPEHLQACYALSSRGLFLGILQERPMKKKSKKLVLAKETVRELMDPDRLKDAAGGQPTVAPTCGVSCIPFETCVRC